MSLVHRISQSIEARDFSALVMLFFVMVLLQPAPGSTVHAAVLLNAGESCECEGDIDGNNAVDVNDLLMVIADWGSPYDVEDLLVIISSWGPCMDLVTDCFGNCAPAAWVGDGYCDDGEYSWNGVDIFFDCGEFSCDGGDCDCTVGACMLPEYTCEVNHADECASIGGLSWVAKATCDDADNDRIPNAFELNDCISHEGAFTGSDPAVADTDGDGIGDGDESYGTVDGLDLPSYGCNPCRQDLLIEADYLYTTGQAASYNQLHSNQVARVVDSFDASSVVNPDGTTGIHMYIDYLDWSNPIFDGNGDLDIPDNDFSLGEFPVYKAANFQANRQGYFHYCIVGNSYNGGGSSGLAEIHGDDFVVTVGGWPATGDNNYVGNTLMHELGHNLNLRHGGFQNRNYKPNYNSVMSYAYQLCGVDADGNLSPDGVLDYSWGVNIALDESSLDEAAGVTGSGPVIDWNENGLSDKSLVSRNINCPWAVWCVGGLSTQDCGTAGNCADSSCNILLDNDDWGTLSLLGISEGLIAPEVVTCMSNPSLNP
jgi:hypothetical protein